MSAEDLEPFAEETRAEVGDSIVVPERTTVTRPDGSKATVVGGLFVLDTPGVYLIDDTELEVF